MGNSRCLFCVVVDVDLLIVTKAVFEKTEGGNVTFGVTVACCSKLGLLAHFRKLRFLLKVTFKAESNKNGK